MLPLISRYGSFSLIALWADYGGAYVSFKIELHGLSGIQKNS